MKYSGINITPNELVKLEILDKLEDVLFAGLDKDQFDKSIYTEKEEHEVYKQLEKRITAIRKLLNADKLWPTN